MARCNAHTQAQCSGACSPSPTCAARHATASNPAPASKAPCTTLLLLYVFFTTADEWQVEPGIRFRIQDLNIFRVWPSNTTTLQECLDRCGAMQAPWAWCAAGAASFTRLRSGAAWPLRRMPSVSPLARAASPALPAQPQHARSEAAVAAPAASVWWTVPHALALPPTPSAAQL